MSQKIETLCDRCGKEISRYYDIKNAMRKSKSFITSRLIRTKMPLSKKSSAVVVKIINEAELLPRKGK